MAQPHTTSEQTWAFSLCIGSACLWLLIFLPFAIYNTFQYYKVSDHIIYKKRYSKYCIYECMLIMLKIVLDATIYLLSLHTSAFRTWSMLLSLNNALSIMLMYAWILRYYMIHYDLQFTRAQLANSWFNLIDAHFQSSKTKKLEWYLKNRKTMGNIAWIRFYVVAPLMIATIIFAIIPRITYTYLFSIADKNHWFEIAIYSQCVMLIPFAILIILYWRTPAFQDSFYIVQELSRLFIILFVYHITSIAFDIYVISLPTYNYYTMSYVVAIFLFAQFRTGCIFVCGQIPTYWVMRKCSKIIQAGVVLESVPVSNSPPLGSVSPDLHTLDDGTTYVPLIKFSVVSVESMDVTHSGNGSRQSIFRHFGANQEQNAEVTLFQCLSHQRGVELFLEHLSTEISVNYLLALICFVQFESYVYDYMRHNGLLSPQQEREHDYDRTLWSEKIRFYAEMPKSSIVYEKKGDSNLSVLQMNGKDFKYHAQFKGYKLYRQFIESGSELQIHVSVQTANALHDVIGDMDRFLFNQSTKFEDLLFLYSSCCAEIVDTLQESYRRFQETTQYRKLQHFVFI